ncbi:MAG: CopD family protein [Thermaerobacterales bacterium]
MDVIVWARLGQVIGAALLAGSIFIWMGRGRSAEGPPAGVRIWLLAVAAAGAALIMTGGLTDLLRLAALVSGQPRWDPATWAVMPVVMTTLPPGIVTTARLGLVVLLAVAFALARFSAAAARPAGFLTVALLFTYGLTGHALTGRVSPWLTVPVHSIHITAGLVWGGALTLLAITGLRWGTASRWFLGLMTGFSRNSLMLMSVLITTGGLAAVIHLYNPRDLVETSYGLTLSLKLWLAASVLAFAALHRWVILPGLRRPGAGLAPVLRISLAVEALLGIGVAAVTAIRLERRGTTNCTCTCSPVKVWPLTGCRCRRDAITSSAASQGMPNGA